MIWLFIAIIWLLAMLLILAFLRGASDDPFVRYGRRWESPRDKLKLYSPSTEDVRKFEEENRNKRRRFEYKSRRWAYDFHQQISESKS